MQGLDPAQTRAVTLLAWRMLCSGRAKDARALFEWLVALMPARGDLRLALAHALLRSHEPSTALTVLEVMASSSDAAPHFLRGKALALCGRMEEAREAFERYREARRPTDPTD